jgi:hypothetical protein
MSKLTILSGGAAKGLVDALTLQFAAETGFSVGGEFSAVGAMAAKLRAGIRPTFDREPVPKARESRPAGSPMPGRRLCCFAMPPMAVAAA